MRHKEQSLITSLQEGTLGYENAGRKAEQRGKENGMGGRKEGRKGKKGRKEGKKEQIPQE